MTTTSIGAHTGRGGARRDAARRESSDEPHRQWWYVPKDDTLPGTDDEAEPDFQARAVREGRMAKELAERAARPTPASRTVGRRSARSLAGVEINFVAEDAPATTGTSTCPARSAGATPGPACAAPTRCGRRSGKAAVLHESSLDGLPRSVVAHDRLPPLEQRRGEALAGGARARQVVFDAVEMLSPDGPAACATTRSTARTGCHPDLSRGHRQDPAHRAGHRGRPRLRASAGRDRRARATSRCPASTPEIWQPVVLPAAAADSPNRDLLLRALDNGRAFRRGPARGRLPEHVEWLGGTRSVWTSDIPRDLTVDGVWFIQAKYDSTCVLNTSPGAMVDELLVDHTLESRKSWFEEVALEQLQALLRRRPAPSFPLDRPARRRARPRQGPKAVLKAAMRGSAAVTRRGRGLRRAVPSGVDRDHACGGGTGSSATLPQRTQMLFRMLRIAGGPYWLLGTKGHTPVRLAVCDTRTWRDRFELEAVHRRRCPRRPAAGRLAGRDPRPRHRRAPRVDGYCEIRWSHGKLQGKPECKVQVTTPLDQIPGYDRM